MTQYLVEEKFLRIKLGGAFCFESIPNADKVADYVFTENSIVSGFSYEAKNFNHGDKLKIEVVHPQAGVLAVMTENWFITDHVTLDLYAFKPLIGMSLRATYTSVGTSVCQFTLNLIKHNRVETV